MPQKNKSKMSRRKYKTKNRRARTFRKNRKQYGGMEKVDLKDLQKNTKYIIKSTKETQPIEQYGFLLNVSKITIKITMFMLVLI